MNWPGPLPRDRAQTIVENSMMYKVTPYEKRTEVREFLVQRVTLDLEVQEAERALGALLQTEYL